MIGAGGAMGCGAELVVEALTGFVECGFQGSSQPDPGAGCLQFRSEGGGEVASSACACVLLTGSRRDCDGTAGR